MTYPLGVDIGTTYTAAALWRDGRVQTVPLGNRANAVPSVLFLRDDGAMVVGEAAARRGITDPDRQAREFKRRMGDDIPILVGGRGFTAHQLTGEVLKWSLERVSELQGGPPQHVVLTHPASWGDYRKNLLVQAAMSAGLREVGLLPEPVAAATWYAAQERIEPGSLIGIYDFGGGTFDASVVRKTATGVEIHGEAGGDDSIGGIDFDHALFRHVGQQAGVDITQLDFTDPVVSSAMAQLFSSVVEAKEALSADTEVVVPVVLPGVSRQVLVTRSEFEELIRQRVLGTVGVFGQVVRRAGVDPSKLHGVLLVGGSSRIPLVRQLLGAELNIRVALDAHPKYTVSLGAAIAAAPRVVGVRSSGGFAPPVPGPPGPVRPMGPPPSGPPPHLHPTQSRPMQYPAGYQQPRPGFHPQHGPGQRSQGAIQMPGNNGPAPAVSEKVDLARSGLTGITDIRTVLAAMQPLEPVTMTPPPARGDQFAQIRTRDPETTGGGAGRGRLIAVLVVVIILAVVAALVFFVLNNKSNTSSNGGTPPATESQAAGLPAVGKITLTGQPLVIPPEGTDEMFAVTGLGNGDVIAVGASQDRKARAWLSKGGGAFTAAEVPVDSQGELRDVAVVGSTVVAVGWTGTGPTNRAAVWTSPDGLKWNLLPPQGDFTPNSGFKRLTAVTSGPGNKLFALGRDDRADRTEGDASVFTSTDGNTWQIVNGVTGLSGTGPQDVEKLTRTSDGTFIAVGSVLAGAKRGPAVWTSKDGVKWDLSPYTPGPPEASPNLKGVARLSDGTLLICGSVGTGQPPPLSCWTQAKDQHWERWSIATDPAAPRAFFLNGLYPVADKKAVAVGVGQSIVDGKNVNDAAMWVTNFGPRQ
ncbi:actin-like ATPase involved in cell morphogenesis [Kibdelosporangium banguiense]|uniref:Actin-like ATPase involved in cell morphogenesis n=1 Tax=Kibdelosporangium banguiense TaxID=1365924 RepID=A0ABS4TZT1_9PSEU|nr:Hsp70 family protein [Kibdelosporangium banguiense]MBP2329905.1 actin-like ATPase involved in cell morphogenesis [Kibdelosporangium banguiense]